MTTIRTAHPEMRKLLEKDTILPVDFLEQQLCRGDNGLFLASCLLNQHLFVSDSFRSLTGYSPGILLHQGIERWFSLIHPEDIERTIKRIALKCVVEPHHYSAKRRATGCIPQPFVLEYRLKHATGKWIWIRDMRCLISYDQQGNKDKFVGFFEDITGEKQIEESSIKEDLEQDQAGEVILNAWNQFIQTKDTDTSVPDLTKREKEILELISQGYSTKQLADHLYISIHTVETHRRHLIEKFDVRNSVELVRKASRTIWL